MPDQNQLKSKLSKNTIRKKEKNCHKLKAKSPFQNKTNIMQLYENAQLISGIREVSKPSFCKMLKKNHDSQANRDRHPGSKKSVGCYHWFIINKKRICTIYFGLNDFDEIEAKGLLKILYKYAKSKTTYVQKINKAFKDNNGFIYLNYLSLDKKDGIGSSAHAKSVCDEYAYNAIKNATKNTTKNTQFEGKYYLNKRRINRTKEEYSNKNYQYYMKKTEDDLKQHNKVHLFTKKQFKNLALELI